MVPLIPGVVQLLEYTVLTIMLTMMIILAAVMLGRMLLHVSDPKDPNWSGYAEGRTP